MALLPNTAQSVGQIVDFQQDVLPVLEQHCLECHNAEEAESALNLESEKSIFRGGDSGEIAIRPGDSNASYLVQRIVSEDPAQRMPPDSDPLPEADLTILRKWIDNSERWSAIAETAATEKSNHWSFQPLKKPTVPAGEGQPIDRFIRHRLKSEELLASPVAEPRTRLRRLSLVVHGLPVSPEQLDQFEKAATPENWQQLVDDYLQSPRYGERWAAHWLDLARYGDTHGFETNRERPNAWRYRDWIINSLNDDLPYTDFIRHQIAGDALGQEVATGFLVAGPYDLVKGQDPLLGLMQRQDELADIINTTGTAFLGLTLGCARCHNHKFDPISQRDYYSLQAVFAGVQHGERTLRLPLEKQQAAERLANEIQQLWANLEEYCRAPVQFDRNEERFATTPVRFLRMTIQQCTGAEPCIDELEVYSGGNNVALASLGTQATSNGDFVHPLHQLEHINDGEYGNEHSWISAKPSGGWIQLEFPKIVEIDRVVWGRDRKGQYRDRLAIDYRFEVSLDGKNWKAVIDSHDRVPLGSRQNTAPELDFTRLTKSETIKVKSWLNDLGKALSQQADIGQGPLAYAGVFSQPEPTFRLYRGDPTMPREQVPPAGITSLDGWSLQTDAPEQDRRLQLADWIADSANPLTARVIVNRIWQHHFGRGIVGTPSDFGANGASPSHPELLDWLACELIENQWSLKHIHRLILTSETWQQSSLPTPAGIRKDADSQLLWRFPPRRLEAEAIRDGILAVTGKLDLTMGGPGFSAFEVEAENVRHYHPKTRFGPEDWRRMIYMAKVRQERDAVFGVFDCPDFSQVIPNRNQSTTPLQALNLFNSSFVLQQADLFVDRLNSEAESDSQKINRAYQLCFGRQANSAELEAAQAFIDNTDWIQFARAMLNANEFLFIQ